MTRSETKIRVSNWTRKQLEHLKHIWGLRSYNAVIQALINYYYTAKNREHLTKPITTEDDIFF